MVWSSDELVESKQLHPCWNYLLVWACGHLQRQLTADRWTYHCCCQPCLPSNTDFCRFTHYTFTWLPFTWWQHILAKWSSCLLFQLGWEQLHQQWAQRRWRRWLGEPQFRGVQRQLLPQLPPEHTPGIQTQLFCHGEMKHCAQQSVTTFGLPLACFVFCKSSAKDRNHGLYLKHLESFTLWFTLYCVLNANPLFWQGHKKTPQT